MPLTGKIQRLLQTIALLSLAGMIVPAGVSAAAGAQGTAAPGLSQAGQVRDHQADVLKVLSVIEHRAHDGKVLDRMREKVGALNDRQLRLAASLCERIALDDHSAGANIAFSIVTAMIVLS
jgi:hypothetical protein